MENTYQVKESFIKEAYNAACSTWKTKLKEAFPDVFKVNVQEGYWYKSTDPNKKTFIFIINANLGIGCGYGFDLYGEWVSSAHLSDDWNWGCELASGEEIRERLISEAKRRFKKGDKISTPSNWGNGKSCDCIIVENVEDFSLQLNNTELRIRGGVNYFMDDDTSNTTINTAALVIFKDGKWAEPFTEPEQVLNKRQIADLLKIPYNNLTIKD